MCDDVWESQWQRMLAQARAIRNARSNSGLPPCDAAGERGIADAASGTPHMPSPGVSSQTPPAARGSTGRAAGISSEDPPRAADESVERYPWRRTHRTMAEIMAEEEQAMLRRVL